MTTTRGGRRHSTAKTREILSSPSHIPIIEGMGERKLLERPVRVCTGCGEDLSRDGNIAVPFDTGTGSRYRMFHFDCAPE